MRSRRTAAFERMRNDDWWWQGLLVLAAVAFLVLAVRHTNAFGTAQSGDVPDRIVEVRGPLADGGDGDRTHADELLQPLADGGGTSTAGSQPLSTTSPEQADTSDERGDTPEVAQRAFDPTIVGAGSTPPITAGPSGAVDPRPNTSPTPAPSPTSPSAPRTTAAPTSPAPAPLPATIPVTTAAPTSTPATPPPTTSPTTTPPAPAPATTTAPTVPAATAPAAEGQKPADWLPPGQARKLDRQP
jgi:hypothetical protein